jgi:GAF domain-containing protein
MIFGTVLRSREERPMTDRTALEKDLRTEAEGLIASDAPDAEVLDRVVRLVHDAHPSWDWSGIYLMKNGVLVLGPSIAPADHDLIEVGEGVCGTAVSEDKNQVIEDVREIENYLACSIHTRSEIVVLIRHGGDVVGQFDIDSDAVGAFKAEDEALLEDLAEVVAPRVASLAAS